MKLRSEDTVAWGCFEWAVTEPVSNPDIFAPRQLILFVNDSHYKRAYIKKSLFEQLHEMKQEYGLLCTTRADRRPPTNVEVARVNSGGWRAKRILETTQTTIQMSLTAKRLDMRVINALGTLMKDEKSEVIVWTKQPLSTVAIMTIAANGLSCLQKIYFFLLIMRVFCTSQWKKNVIQIDTLYRLRDGCQKNDYWPVWKNILYHYELCFKAQ